MYQSVKIFKDLVSHLNLDDLIYGALSKDDTAELVMTVLDILTNTELNFPSNEVKTKEASTLRRNEGNSYYVKGHYQRALASYNNALLYAPKNSREMKLAYSNRSALYAKLSAWTACHNDITRIFTMGCPSDIEEKLIKRQHEAQLYHSQEELMKNIMCQAATKFVNFNSNEHNPQIPCASSDVKIDSSTPLPKVILAKNIKVGTVLALEQAYVSYTQPGNTTISCHYCQKIELNLIPCEGCCYALFCNEECKENCMREYHEYECKILYFIKKDCDSPSVNLTVKACLKLLKSCTSWKEFINASYNMGNNRIKSSSSGEIYDTNNKDSVLCFRDDKTFAYAYLYHGSIIVAHLIYYLKSNCPTLLPKNIDKKHKAMQALARILVSNFVYQKPVPIVQQYNNLRSDKTGAAPENFGFFPFISKLKNSCDPNTIIVNKNNRLLLIALRPIIIGEEITVPFFWHRYDCLIPRKPINNLTIFKVCGTVCSCNRCMDNNNLLNISKEKLTKSQKKYYSQLNVRDLESQLNQLRVNNVYKEVINGLTVLKNVPNSKEYLTIFILWRRCLSFFEIVCSNNNILDDSLNDMTI